MNFDINLQHWTFDIASLSAINMTWNEKTFFYFDSHFPIFHKSLFKWRIENKVFYPLLRSLKYKIFAPIIRGKKQTFRTANFIGIGSGFEKKNVDPHNSKVYWNCKFAFFVIRFLSCFVLVRLENILLFSHVNGQNCNEKLKKNYFSHRWPNGKLFSSSLPVCTSSVQHSTISSERVFDNRGTIRWMMHQNHCTRMTYEMETAQRYTKRDNKFLL